MSSTASSMKFWFCMEFFFASNFAHHSCHPQELQAKQQQKPAKSSKQLSLLLLNVFQCLQISKIALEPSLPPSNANGWMKKRGQLNSSKPCAKQSCWTFFWDACFLSNDCLDWFDFSKITCCMFQNYGRQCGCKEHFDPFWVLNAQNFSANVQKSTPKKIMVWVQTFCNLQPTHIIARGAATSAPTRPQKHEQHGLVLKCALFPEHCCKGCILKNGCQDTFSWSWWLSPSPSSSWSWSSSSWSSSSAPCSSPSHLLRQKYHHLESARSHLTMHGRGATFWTSGPDEEVITCHVTWSEVQLLHFLFVRAIQWVYGWMQHDIKVWVQWLSICTPPLNCESSAHSSVRNKSLREVPNCCTHWKQVGIHWELYICPFSRSSWCCCGASDCLSSHCSLSLIPFWHCRMKNVASWSHAVKAVRNQTKNPVPCRFHSEISTIQTVKQKTKRKLPMAPPKADGPRAPPPPPGASPKAPGPGPPPQKSKVPDGPLPQSRIPNKVPKPPDAPQFRVPKAFESPLQKPKVPRPPARVQDRRRSPGYQSRPAVRVGPPPPKSKVPEPPWTAAAVVVHGSRPWQMQRHRHGGGRRLQCVPGYQIG